MKTTNLRFVFLLALSTLLGCALGQAAARPTGAESAAGARHDHAAVTLSGASARHSVTRWL